MIERGGALVMSASPLRLYLFRDTLALAIPFPLWSRVPALR